MDINNLLRENIRCLQPYSSARNEFSGEAMIFLDANENPFNPPYNRYPDPMQREVKNKISRLKNISSDRIFLGNGSDEPIDLLIRAFCEPGVENIVSIHPTYGMYQVAAAINNVNVVHVSLTENFELDAQKVLNAVDEKTKLIFLCSPNNPTGNCFNHEDILEVLNHFRGIVVLDEAYIDFAPGKSLLAASGELRNLVILQTFSKAWGMAGIRLGMAFAPPEIISVLNKIKYPYNLNILTQTKALELIENAKQVEIWTQLIIAERKKMEKMLTEFPFVVRIFPSDANFILVKMHDAKGIYDYLKDQGIIVRDRSRVHLCEDSLRITVGSPDENEQLTEALKNLV
ncbi:MAG: histidinol-phosphate transaminase [Mariniphaga sp.]|nr:histidinol-phosphate transaminase [Mariniphaga sp.]MDD4224767.1 histidinol-phosphate transaminase [Mariniphaga sp.]